MAAEVLLARREVTDDEIDGIVAGTSGHEGGGEGEGVGMSVVHGGVQCGSVVGVWGDGGEVCKTLLVDSLLKYAGSVAAVVDSTGNFDVVGLYAAMLERVKKEPGSAGGDEQRVAAEMLDRVKIMRVFDFVGVREAVGEIRDGLEGTRKERMATPKQPTPEPLTPEVPKRTVVADSEDEEEDEDEEMLFDAAPQAPSVPVSEPPKPPREQAKDSQAEASQASTKFILINNLTQVLTPLLKKDYIQANALLSPFLHSLAQLTRTHALHTVLSNPAPIPRPSSPVRHQAPEQQKPQPPPSPSIFASNAVVPSLMGVLARHVDVGLLVSVLPKGKMDARVVYRDGGSVGTVVKKLRGVEYIKVVEVMSDRWEARQGFWKVVKPSR